MTANSIETYHQTTELRQTNKTKCLEALRTERNQSRFEIGRKTGLGDIEAQRRLSDLVNEDKATITGSRKHGLCEVSLYSEVSQLQLFNTKKLSLRQWLKREHPEIWEKYKTLILHEL